MDNSKKIIAYEKNFQKSLKEAISLIDTTTKIGETFSNQVKLSLRAHGNYSKDFNDIVMCVEGYVYNLFHAMLPKEYFSIVEGQYTAKDICETINRAALDLSTPTETFEQSLGLVESIQDTIYCDPKNVDSIIRDYSKKFKISENDLMLQFVKEVGVPIREYASMILDEGLGDYINYKAGKAANTVRAKYGWGDTRRAANANKAVYDDSETILTGWNIASLGKKEEATSQKIKTFLMNRIQAQPQLIDPILRKYANAPDALVTTNSTGKNGKPVKIQYFKPGVLRNIFVDVVKSIKQLDINRKPVKNNQKPNTKNQPVNLQQTNMNQKHVQPNQQATPTPAPAPNFAQTIQSLPQNQRAAAVLQALPSLSNDDIRTILTALTTKKP